MTHSRRTPEGRAATEVVLATFQAYGLLLSNGDLLAAHEHLTSTRWQVLGAVALKGQPLTVPQIARRMGRTRQSVHMTVSRLVADGLVALIANIDHASSRLVALTEAGRAKYAAVDRRQTEWVNRLADGMNSSELETTARVLDELCRKLETRGARHGARNSELVNSQSPSNRQETDLVRENP